MFRVLPRDHFIHILGILFRGVNFWKYKTPRGAAGDETRVFGNPDFGKKSRFENGLVDLF